GETPQYGGTARFSNKAELPNDDPTLTGSITSRNVLSPLHGNGGLVGTKREANGEPRPVLAESWTMSEDAKIWTFKLRSGVLWHDGTPLVAEDVKFSLNLGLTPPKGRRATSIGNSLPGLQDIQVVDEHTVRLVFNQFSAHLLEALASTGNEIALPRHLGQKELDKGNVTFGLAPLGWVSLGPYKYDQYVRGGSFTVVRFDKYWEKDAQGRSMPYLDSVVNTPIPDRAVALGAFRAGRLDAMSRGAGTSLDPQEVQILKKSLPGKVWYHRFPYLDRTIDMNAQKPPFSDIRARKAVFLYMDREEGAQKMLGGHAHSSGWLSPSSWWASNAYKEWPGYTQATKKQDQAEAKRLMQEAGLVGASAPITCRTDYLYMCEFQLSVLTELGFKSEIMLLDVNAEGEAGRTMNFITKSGGICDGLLPNCLASLVSTAVNARYNDPKLDAWDRTISTSTDPLARREALWAAERYFLLEQAHAAPFLREEVVAPYRTYLKGSIVPGYQAGDNSDRATDWIDKKMQ
ncbi:MAG: transporter substrate-binding protein, partial [Dehalococcoidia bacterium]|nr:transporter substrate-binding protein [Dehalococcoidia bacterium]